MGKSYCAKIIISGLDMSCRDEIEKACEAEWPFDSWSIYHDFHQKEKSIEACSNGELPSGETEEALFIRLCHAVWKANKSYCYVSVYTTPRKPTTNTGTREMYLQMNKQDGEQ